MKLRIVLAALAALTVAVAIPSNAAAVPPTNDNVVNAIPVNLGGPPNYGPFNFTNIDATVETWEINGGYLSCTKPNGVVNNYGRTIWFRIRPNVNGALTMNAQTLDFFAVIGLIPYNPSTGAVGAGRCFVADASGQAYFPPHYIEATDYLVQIGGVNSFQGNLSFQMHFDPDTDGDRWLDFVDECARAPGSDALHGCPDADGDGVPDQRDGAASPDKCLGEKGSPNRPDGCLDSDVDGFINRSDRCPTRSGGLQGCPDVDADGIADPDDKCPGENSRARDQNKNGCLDYRSLNPTVKLFFKGTSKGIKVTLFQVKDVPSGARVSASCSRRACSRQFRKASVEEPSARAAKDVTLPRLRKNLRAGTKVFIRVTASRAVGKYYVVNIKKGRYKASKAKCLRPGSKKPTKNCGTAR